MSQFVGVSAETLDAIQGSQEYGSIVAQKENDLLGQERERQMEKDK